MKLTFVLPSLTCGGAERSAILLAQGLTQNDHEVTILTFKGYETDFYDVPKAVRRVSLNLDKKSSNFFVAIWNNLKNLKRLRKEIIASEPDVVISFLDVINILTLLSIMNSGYPVIVSEQNNPAMATQNFWRIWSILRRFSYTFASKVVSSSQGVDEYFNWLPKKQRLVIYNPLVPINRELLNSEINNVNLQEADPQKKWAVAMGRLTYQKGFDILLSAFAKISDKHPDWQLIILGEGEDKVQLKKITEDLLLNKKVILPGAIKNPFPILAKSKLFILSSRFEGFGNVLIEAMACGLPVVSTDCPSGPREIVQDSTNGILVKNQDVDLLAEAIDFLMFDEKERQRLASNSFRSVERFSLDNITLHWQNLIHEVISGDSI